MIRALEILIITVMVVALSILIGIWRTPTALADWRESYRDGYRAGYTLPDEDGIRAGNPSVPTPETPRVAEDDDEAFARGAIDGNEFKENQEEEEE